MKGGDRYEPRKTFLLADLQEIVSVTGYSGHFDCSLATLSFFDLGIMTSLNVD